MNTAKMLASAQQFFVQDEGDPEQITVTVVPSGKAQHAILVVTLDGKLYPYRWNDKKERWDELK